MGLGLRPTNPQILLFGRRQKTPTPKTRFSIRTLLRTPGRFTTRPLRVHFTTELSVVRPFSLLSKDKICPLVKRAVFLLRLKSWGWGSFPPLSNFRTKPHLKNKPCLALFYNTNSDLDPSLG